VGSHGNEGGWMDATSNINLKWYFNERLNPPEAINLASLILFVWLSEIVSLFGSAAAG
jgi:hypothetical protein